MRHEHAVEGAHGPTGPATVMADIGGDTGAAVVYAPPRFAGREIEIRSAAGEWDGTHTAVRERHVGETVLYAGFFASLPADHSIVRLRGDEGPTLTVEVRGGHVAEARW
jgi:hypothetical protein